MISNHKNYAAKIKAAREKSTPQYVCDAASKELAEFTSLLLEIRDAFCADSEITSAVDKTLVDCKKLESYIPDVNRNHSSLVASLQAKVYEISSMIEFSDEDSDVDFDDSGYSERLEEFFTALPKLHILKTIDEDISQAKSLNNLNTTVNSLLIASGTLSTAIAVTTFILTGEVDDKLSLKLLMGLCMAFSTTCFLGATSYVYSHRLRESIKELEKKVDSPTHIIQ